MDMLSKDFPFTPIRSIRIFSSTIVHTVQVSLSHILLDKGIVRVFRIEYLQVLWRALVIPIYPQVLLVAFEQG